MMEHEAFVFYEAFERELRPSLEDALGTGDTSRLEFEALLVVPAVG